jgi:DNA-binding NarL/FixJ family response regulator
LDKHTVLPLPWRFAVIPAHRVLVVADDPLARGGLATLLNDEPSIDVVGRSTIDDAMDMVAGTLQPDAVVLDAGYADDVPDAITELLGSRLPLVVLLPDDAHASEVYLDGARALLLRDASSGELAIAIAAAVQGLSILAPALTDAIAAPADNSPEPDMGVLTRRELEVVRLVAEGHSNKEIAYELDISDHTVKFHVNSILRKLGARSRTEAATIASRLGLLYL